MHTCKGRQKQLVLLRCVPGRLKGDQQYYYLTLGWNVLTKDEHQGEEDTIYTRGGGGGFGTTRIA